MSIWRLLSDIFVHRNNFFHSLLSLLPTTISKDSKFANALQERLNSQIQSEIAESFKRTCADLDMNSKLTKLDEVCKKAKVETEAASGKENSDDNTENKKAWYVQQYNKANSFQFSCFLVWKV